LANKSIPIFVIVFLVSFDGVIFQNVSLNKYVLQKYAKKNTKPL
jgi:hypothetical protein